MAQEGQWKFLLGCGSIFILCFLIALYGVATGHADKVAEFLLVCLGLACIAGCGAAAGVKDVEPEAPMNTLNRDYEWTWRLTALIEQRLRRTKHVYTIIVCTVKILFCLAAPTSWPRILVSQLQVEVFTRKVSFPVAASFYKASLAVETSKRKIDIWWWLTKMFALADTTL